jgi:hypothetical protein
MGQLGFDLGRIAGDETPNPPKPQRMSSSYIASHANCSLARNDWKSI